jgi:hypothetical protein
MFQLIISFLVILSYDISNTAIAVYPSRHYLFITGTLARHVQINLSYLQSLILLIMFYLNLIQKLISYAFFTRVLASALSRFPLEFEANT